MWTQLLVIAGYYGLPDCVWPSGRTRLFVVTFQVFFSELPGVVRRFGLSGRCTEIKLRTFTDQMDVFFLFSF